VLPVLRWVTMVGADVVEGLQPRLEDRRDFHVFLRIHAADLAAAVVQVEVRGNLAVVAARLQLAARIAQGHGHRLFLRIGRSANLPKWRPT
jgi:hypothetical protein